MKDAEEKEKVAVMDKDLDDFTCEKCGHHGMRVRPDTPPFDVATCPDCGHEATISYGTEKGLVI